jgi:hypothetical protein
MNFYPRIAGKALWGRGYEELEEGVNWDGNLMLLQSNRI